MFALIATALGSVAGPSPVSAAGGTTLFFLTSASGDPVGDGIDVMTSQFSITRPATDRLRFVSGGSPTVVVEMIDPAGTFTLDEWWQGPSPVLSISIDGRTCSLLESEFKIDEIVMSGSVPSRIAVRFGYNCGAPVYASSIGTIALDATVPVYAATYSPKQVSLELPVGSIVTRTVTYTNVGPSTITTTGSGSNSTFGQLSGCDPVTIAPGASCAMTLTMEGVNRGAENGFAYLSDSMLSGRAGARASGVRVTTNVVPAVGTARFAADSEARDPAGLGLHDVASNFGQEQWIGSIGGAATNSTWFAAVARLTGQYPPVGVVVTSQQSGFFMDAFAGTSRCPQAQRSGSFLVDDFAVSPTNATKVVRYSARFRQRCNGDPTAELFGSINLDSSMPFYSHAMGPKAIEFGAHLVGSSAPGRPVTITNDGGAPLTISSLTIGGADPGAFSLSSDCPSVLAVGASCTVTVGFIPTGPFNYSATLQLVDSMTNFAGDGASQDVVLSGSGASVLSTARQISPDRLDLLATFPGSTSGTIEYRNTGSTPLRPVVTGAVPPFAVTHDSCTGVAIAPSGVCTIEVTYTPTAVSTVSATVMFADEVAPLGLSYLVTGNTIAVAPPPTPGPGSGTGTGSGTVGTPTPSTDPSIPGNRYVPVTPGRLLDTRVPIGRPTVAKLRPYETVRIPVVGSFGVPAGATSVAVNLTGTDSDADGGYLTLYPSGDDLPDTSNLNVDAGEAAPNMVIVAVGADGAIVLANGPTALHALVDVTGYFGAPAGVSSSGLHMITPDRLVDTRSGSPLGAGTHRLQIGGIRGVPASARAVVVNVTGVSAALPTFVTLFASGAALPPTSTLNLLPGEARPNLAIVELGVGGGIDAFVDQGSVHLLVDVVAWLGEDLATPGLTTAQRYGGGFYGVSPERIFDTRIDPPAFGPDEVDMLGFPTVIAGRRVTGVVLNVTVTNPTEGGYLTLFPGDVDEIPDVSNLNFEPGQTIANLVTVKIPDDGDVWIYNPFGTTDVIVDVMGLVIE